MTLDYIPWPKTPRLNRDITITEKIDGTNGAVVIVPPKYEVEVLGEDDDDGTMPQSVSRLEEAVIGHRIVSAEWGTTEVAQFSWSRDVLGLILTLDTGKQVVISGTDDCCAYTELRAFLLNVDKVEHVITGVGTTDGYTTWHIFADAGDVMELTVDWSCGNPFYYGYGFDIAVKDVEEL